MAIDSFMAFQKYDGSWLEAESQVDLSKNSNDQLWQKPVALQEGKVFEVDDYSFDVEQTLSIGSQSRGAGAGKITFNPFSITRKIDKASPLMYKMACNGTPFQMVVLMLRKAAGTEATGSFFLRFNFKLVAIKTISWSHDDESPKEEMTFEYGALFMSYGIQEPSGEVKTVIQRGWNRVKNVGLDTGIEDIK